MKKFSTLFIGLLLPFVSSALTTVYTTGQSYGDEWTGWSAPVMTGVTSNAVNSGTDVWAFNGTGGTPYTIQTYRQFSINSNELYINLFAQAQNSTIVLEVSLDNVTYTTVATTSWGGGFTSQAVYAAGIDAGATNFYLRIKATGTFAGGQTAFTNLKIEANNLSTNSVSISPLTTQNILIGANGTMLTATETPAAVSRQWKYSTVSGAGYVVFSSPQTGLTYTPNFATAGTYYVICESNYGGGDLQQSSEVRINVTAPAAVEEFTLGSSIFYTGGILEIKSLIQQYNVQVYDINGQLIVSEQNMKSYDFSAHNAGIYFVTFQYEGQRKTVKIANVR